MSKTMTWSPMAIDYPGSGEVVTAPHCSLRIAAGDGASVQVSIDGGSWQPCRFDRGYWWYDWDGYRSGYHLLSAQASGADGRVLALEARHVAVELGSDEPPEPRAARRRRHE